jgi:2-polyprenyl-6-methoxyphenol hydroxylase-like FAD-dependent oxidoreductase
MALVTKVLIIGGGPAGLCAAIVLAKRGIDVEIAEISPDLRPLGSGVAIAAPSVRALRMVDEDALHGFFRDGYGHQALSFGNVDGQIVRRVELPRLAGPEFPAGLGILRPVLWGVLAEAAQRAGARIRLSATVTEILQHPDGVEVSLSDGSRADYDLLVGADGLHSRVRELAFSDVPAPFFTGQVAWRVMVSRDEEITDGIVVLTGPRGRVGCNPVSADEMYVFVVENIPQLGDPPPEQQWPELVQAMLAPFGGAIGRARELMTDPAKIDRRPLFSILVRAPWHRGRVVLIGDAAHSTTPHLAMGAGIAVEDAVVLGQVLGSHKDMDAALSEFMTRRWERCRLVVENSLQLVEWDKHPGAPGADPAGLSDTSIRALAAPF